MNNDESHRFGDFNGAVGNHGRLAERMHHGQFRRRQPRRGIALITPSSRKACRVLRAATKTLRTGVVEMMQGKHEGSLGCLTPSFIEVSEKGQQDGRTIRGPAALISPGLCALLRPTKGVGMPVPAPPASLACKSVSSTRAYSPRLQPDSPGIPHANGFSGFLRALVSARCARMCERAVLTNPQATRKQAIDYRPLYCQPCGSVTVG